MIRAGRALSLVLWVALAALAAQGAARASEPPPPAASEPSATAEPDARAQADEEAERQKLEARRTIAREKGRRALELLRAGKHAEAYPLFRDANEEFHTPQLVLYMARCQEKRGKLLEARALYERVLLEPLPESPSESLLRARQAAAAEVGPVRLRIPTLAIDVRGPPPAEVTLFVDGELWPIAEPRELDPGRHEVEALSRSGARTSREVELPEGRSVSIVLRLGLFASRVVSTPEPPQPEPTRPTWSLVAASGAFTVGALSLVTGISTGILTLQRRETFSEACLSARCTREGFTAYEEARSYAKATNAALVTAALTLGAGATIVVLTTPKSRGDVQAAIELRVGPLGLGVGGAF